MCVRVSLERGSDWSDLMRSGGWPVCQPGCSRVTSITIPMNMDELCDDDPAMSGPLDGENTVPGKDVQLINRCRRLNYLRNEQGRQANCSRWTCKSSQVRVEIKTEKGDVRTLM